MTVITKNSIFFNVDKDSELWGSSRGLERKLFGGSKLGWALSGNSANRHPKTHLDCGLGSKTALCM